MVAKQSFHPSGWVFLCLIFALMGTAFPAAAQETTETEELILVEGVYRTAPDGTLMVGEYVIAPAGAFLPSDLEDGMFVLMTGLLLPDGLTVQALTLEVVETPEFEATAEGPGDEQDSENGNGQNPGNRNGNRNGNSSNQGNGNGHRGNGNAINSSQGSDNQDEADVEGAEERGFYCSEQTERQHPAAERLAQEAGVAYNEVMGYFCDDSRGFGEIMIVYRLSSATGQSVENLLALRDAGAGWGQLMQDLGVHPGDVMGHRGRGHSPLDEAVPPGLSGGNGRGNGNANGNGNGNRNGNSSDSNDEGEDD